LLWPFRRYVADRRGAIPILGGRARFPPGGLCQARSSNAMQRCEGESKPGQREKRAQRSLSACAKYIPQPDASRRPAVVWGEVSWQSSD